MIDSDIAWDAVLRRDRSYDGQFVTGVHSTGIYCRPSCAARHPSRANVRFYTNGDQARAAGLRPCKRCLPDDVARDEQAVMAAIGAIRNSQEPLALANLAGQIGYSPSHFQRVFARHTGMSPSAYARALRAERARQALSDGAERVADAIYDAGFSAPSRFYETMQGRMGMDASVWRNGGRGQSIRWTIVATSLGEMLVAASAKGVCRLSFNEDEADLISRFPNAQLVSGDDAFHAMVEAIVAGIAAPQALAHVPIDVRGTAFQEAVWRALQAIPMGETRSYAEIAASIGKPAATRAVGSACGANPVAMLIPCHRALRSDGTLGGYAYGLAIKQDLLKQERAD